MRNLFAAEASRAQVRPSVFAQFDSPDSGCRRYRGYFRPACVAPATAGVEPAGPRGLYDGLLELVGAHLFFRREGHFRMATYPATLSPNLSGGRERHGAAGILRCENRGSWKKCRFRSRTVELDHGKQ